MSALSLTREAELISLWKATEKTRIDILLEVAGPKQDIGFAIAWAAEKLGVGDTQLAYYTRALRTVTNAGAATVTERNVEKLAAMGSTRQTLEKFEQKYLPPPSASISQPYDYGKTMVNEMFRVADKLMATNRKEYIKKVIDLNTNEPDIWMALQVFGVVPGTSWEFVEAGARNLIQREHPDKGGSARLYDMYVKSLNILKLHRRYFRE